MSPYYRSVRPRFFMSTWLISRHILEVVLYPFSNKKLLLNQTRNTRSLPGSCAIETNFKDDSSYFSPVLALNACNCTRSLPVKQTDDWTTYSEAHILVEDSPHARRKAQGARASPFDVASRILSLSKPVHASHGHYPSPKIRYSSMQLLVNVRKHSFSSEVFADVGARRT